jgi:glycolate oxidase FAD binding subunit
MSTITVRPENITDLKSIVCEHPCLHSYGGGTKSSLHSSNDEVVNIDFTGLTGMIEYNPSEYTFTAYSGTRLQEIVNILGDHGQYLPFDPPFITQGGTIGGTLAAGLSGSGRFRYGGIRDFILGVSYVNGEGNVIKSGGKVVKNAAGFDLPKLMIGCLGRYGGILECSFKVFPKPKAYKTLIISYDSIEEALTSLIKLAGKSIEIYALDIWPQSDRIDLIVRLGGVPDSFQLRVERLRNILGSGDIIEDRAEQEFWDDINGFSWHMEDGYLIKIPINPKIVKELDGFLSDSSAKRYYSVGCNVVWVSWSGDLDNLGSKLEKLSLSGLILLGDVVDPHLGAKRSNTFSIKIKNALDPNKKWVEV